MDNQFDDKTGVFIVDGTRIFDIIDGGDSLDGAVTVDTFDGNIGKFLLEDPPPKQRRSTPQGWRHFPVLTHNLR